MARKILLADDSVTAQNMGRRILSDAGYDVTTVNNGSAALKKIAESKPDLIILDVYMPGYGGLEVCQRVRESQETARIPVLLTVGKLEPFKADEARRVRADAFIVKPFEASELLTALTKLEDKIVPRSQPYKPGRFAKAMAAAEEDSQKNEYGDTETGWKNRLKIPPPHHPKPHDSDEPKAESRPAHEDVAANITPEEMAAIQAAAAAFSENSSATDAKPAAEEKVPAQAEPAAPQPAAQEVAATPAPEIPAESAPSAVSSETPAAVSAAGIEPTSSDQKPLQEEEVNAALASLAPNAETSEEPAPVTMAAATAQSQFSGPRWIADPVQLSESEASLILEEEMHKAMAAMAEAASLSVVATVEEAPTPSTEATASQNETASFAMESSTPADAPKPEEPVAPAVAETPASTTTDVVATAAPVEVVAEVQPEAAFAAAAAAGSTNEPVPFLETSTAAVPQGVASPAPVNQQHEAELAAAWASWKQERETPAARADTTRPAPEQAAPASESESASDDSGIASIVDSVLAELKPKLMQEIAKKMGKDKK